MAKAKKKLPVFPRVKRGGKGKGRQRRVKFDETKQHAYCEMISRGVGRMAAAAACRVDRHTVSTLRATDEKFRERVSTCEMEATDAVENALWKSTQRGNVTACIFWLLNRRSDKWKDLRNTAGLVQPAMTMQQITKIIHHTFHVKPDGTGDKGVRLKEGVPGLTVTETEDDNGNDDGSGNGSGT